MKGNNHFFLLGAIFLIFVVKAQDPVDLGNAEGDFNPEQPTTEMVDIMPGPVVPVPEQVETQFEEQEKTILDETPIFNSQNENKKFDIQQKTNIKDPFKLRDPFKSSSVSKRKEGKKTAITGFNNQDLLINANADNIKVVGVFVGAEKRAFAQVNKGPVVLLKEGSKIGSLDNDITVKAILPGGVVIVEKITNVYNQVEYLESVIPVGIDGLNDAKAE
jgi:hypothetical protein